MLADGYDKLWKKVEDAAKRDLPRTQIEHLQKITDKAERDGNYGQLLKAEWRKMWVWSQISPDSLPPQMARLERKAAGYEATDPALAAVCYAALGKTCRGQRIKGYDPDTASQAFFKKALADPAMLASKTVDAYGPFVEKGRDAAVFGGDLLSLIGYTAGDYETMHAYYAATPNRAATLLTALDLIRQNARQSGDMYAGRLEGSAYAASLDSLSQLYSDLNVCCEVAIAKYELMGTCRDVTAKDKADYINYALDRWGEWPRAEELRNAMRLLTCPMFKISSCNSTIQPGTTVRLPVKARNIDRLTLTLTRLDVDGTVKQDPRNDNDYKRLMAKASADKKRSETLTFNGHADYEEVEDTVTISGLTTGVYMLEMTAGGNGPAPERRLLYVTDMYVVHHKLPGDKLRVAVVSGTTGQPVAGAKLYMEYGRGMTRTVTCDAAGETTINAKGINDLKLRACTAADNAMPYTDAWNSFGYYDADTKGEYVSLYTDRRIYRPGQTVHVAAVMRSVDGLEQKAVGGKTFKLTLKDANYKTVAEKDITTDDYGTARADFALPSGVLTGTFTLRTDNRMSGYAYIRVEEYKRPTFMVEFDKVEEKYANGDTLNLTGRATTYSGVPVQGAKVKYSVRRHKALWWRYGGYGTASYGYDDDILAEGEAVTDGSGEFTVAAPMLLPEWESGVTPLQQADYYRAPRFYDIMVEADVTDLAGETRSGKLSLPLGSKPAALGCDVPEKVLRDSLKTITFTLKNAAGNDISGDVTYTVSGMEGTFTAKANTATAVNWGTAAVLKSGRHTLTAVCAGDTVRRDFIVFDYDDTKPCIETPDWFYVSGDEFPRDGSPVYLQFGSSDTDVHVLYTVISGNKVLKSGTLELSDKVITRKLAYEENYGTGLLISMVWVKNGKAYNHETTIRKPMPDKRLVLKWGTFRDRLTPGQQEEWTLNITKPDGTPADAQLLATMYDASLDQIAKFSWAFPSYMTMPLPFGQWRGANGYSMFIHSTADLNLPGVEALDFGNIMVYDGLARDEMANGKVFNTVEVFSSVQVRGSAPLMKKDAAAAQKSATADFNTTGSITLEENVVTSSTDEPESTGQDVPLRENLNETAFFYPSLHTDSAGNVSVKFTLPESVTTWRFMGLAHDKLMNNGLINATSVASKDVMIQPNMPRFVRVGDRARISARIFNMSANTVKGTAVMRLIDPETEETVLTVKSKFNVAADSTGSVSFDYEPDGRSSLLICRISAEDENFSDGEQHYLPVLPDAEMVTNTVPFTQHGAGVKTIDLKPLLPDDARNGKLTIEYTNNPAWLMIQTLPYINNAREDNAVSLATAYYANSISAYIMKQSPRIKTVFDQWRMEVGQESLKSSLEKNQELKNIVLDETPWAADADHESDQKQTLANYFNESNLAENLASTLEKLRKLQSAADGSWCWWPGMRYGSFTLTANVTETLVRLNNMVGKQEGTSDMIDKAMKFLGEKVVADVEEVKKRRNDGTPYVTDWSNAVQYLYISALSNRNMTQEEKAAADYVLADVKKNNSGLSLYNKAIMAVILAERGETALAGEYVRSLDEYTVESEETGRYYDSPRAAYSWFDYRIPTQVAAIEAMTLINAEKYATETDEMKRWLLQQKRVQGWDTPINSVNAVYAFLNGNMDALESKAQATLAIDGKQLDLPASTAGLGYVKTTASADGAKVFTATKTADGTSWGAVYAQSQQKTSAITQASAGFTITREITGTDGKPTTAPNVGDRVKVRITIKADRDYDYVQIKDKRAACMEPVNQLSSYRSGYYCSPKDNATYYYFDRLSKGTHIIETEYYIDRTGRYETGTCTVECAYAPEYSARAASRTIEIK